LKEKVLKKIWKSTEDMPVLFGIPLSMKDVFDIKGYDATLGTAT